MTSSIWPMSTPVEFMAHRICADCKRVKDRGGKTRGRNHQTRRLRARTRATLGVSGVQLAAKLFLLQREMQLSSGQRK